MPALFSTSRMLCGCAQCVTSLESLSSNLFYIDHRHHLLLFVECHPITTMSPDSCFPPQHRCMMYISSAQRMAVRVVFVLLDRWLGSAVECCGNLSRMNFLSASQLFRCSRCWPWFQRSPRHHTRPHIDLSSTIIATVSCQCLEECALSFCTRWLLLHCVGRGPDRYSCRTRTLQQLAAELSHNSRTSNQLLHTHSVV